MSQPQSTIDLAAAEDALRAEKENLENRLGRFSAPVERGSALGFGKRIGDGTIEAVDRLNTIGVGRDLESRLERVDRALAKLAAGSYGTCDSCGSPIDPRRLHAAPESSVCASCPRPRH